MCNLGLSSLGDSEHIASEFFYLAIGHAGE